MMKNHSSRAISITDPNRPVLNKVKTKRKKCTKYNFGVILNYFLKYTHSNPRGAIPSFIFDRYSSPNKFVVNYDFYTSEKSGPQTTSTASKATLLNKDNYQGRKKTSLRVS